MGFGIRIFQFRLDQKIPSAESQNFGNWDLDLKISKKKTESQNPGDRVFSYEFFIYCKIKFQTIFLPIVQNLCGQTSENTAKM